MKRVRKKTKHVARTKLDYVLDMVKRGQHEVTFDTEGYSETDRARIVETARSRGLHAARAGRFILIREL
jgi:hypothetical protein